MAQVIGFQWLRSPNDIARSVGINANTLKFMAQDWHRLYAPFTPMRTGMLAFSVRYGASGNTATITHIAPYARRLYHGRGMKFSRDAHPLASAYWDKAAEAAGKKATLISDVERYMKRGS